MKTANNLQELVQQEDTRTIISRCDSTDSRINAKLANGCKYAYKEETQHA